MGFVPFPARETPMGSENGTVELAVSKASLLRDELGNIQAGSEMSKLKR